MKKLSQIIAVLFIATIASAFCVPDTGQKKCYDKNGEISCPDEGEGYYGQDGNYERNPMSFTKLDKNGNELPDSSSHWAMVRDNVTCLIWEVKTRYNKENKYTWQDAKDEFIRKLNSSRFGGYSDWRLPHREELRSIVDYGKYDPAVNEQYFPYTMSSFYWSSSTTVGHRDGAWGVYFNGGDGTPKSKSSKYFVRAVREGQCR